MSVDDEFEKWRRGVVAPDIVMFAERAERRIVEWANALLSHHICCLFWSLGSATYDALGKLEKTEAPGVAMGSYLRHDVPERYLTKLFGHDILLRIDPFFGDRELNFISVDYKDGRFETEFDP